MSIHAINPTQITPIDRSLVTAKPAHAKSASLKIAAAPGRDAAEPAPKPKKPHGHERSHGHEKSHGHERSHGHEKSHGHEGSHGHEKSHGHEGSHGHEDDRAHGVLRRLEAGQFKATPEARLMAKFGHMLPKTDEPPAPENPDVTPLTPNTEGVVAEGASADKSPVPLDSRYPTSTLSGVEAEQVTPSINFFA